MHCREKNNAQKTACFNETHPHAREQKYERAGELILMAKTAMMLMATAKLMNALLPTITKQFIRILYFVSMYLGPDGMIANCEMTFGPIIILIKQIRFS